MKKQYEKALDKLPKGSLIEKKIKGHIYYYLAVRESKKVKFIYKGKISEEEKKNILKLKSYEPNIESFFLNLTSK